MYVIVIYVFVFIDVNQFYDIFFNLKIKEIVYMCLFLCLVFDVVDVVKVGIEMLYNMICVRFVFIGFQFVNFVFYSNYVYFFS